MLENAINAAIRYASEHFAQKLEELGQAVAQVSLRVHRSVEGELNNIPGRRCIFTPRRTQTFTTADQGIEGDVLLYDLPKDGPWVMTHYPIVEWKITAAAAPTFIGQWRPVGDWPTVSQQLSHEFLNCSLRIRDAGPERDLQNTALLKNSSVSTQPFAIRHVPAGDFSRPGAIKKLPVPTLFPAKSVVAINIFYDAVVFDPFSIGKVFYTTTEGELTVTLPGYRIANL